jgi:hypothetical protein
MREAAGVSSGDQGEQMVFLKISPKCCPTHTYFVKYNLKFSV